MKKLFATQCTDTTSGNIGSFTFDKAQADRDGVFKATSPVFKDTLELFDYCNANKIELAYYAPYNFPAKKG